MREAILAEAAAMGNFTAFFAVGVCVYLALVYLTREAALSEDWDLATLWRKAHSGHRHLDGFLSLYGIGATGHRGTPDGRGLRLRGWPLIGASWLAGIASLWVLWQWRFTMAVLGAATTVATVVVGWGVAQLLWFN